MILTQALWRQKATKPQYGLSRAERRENLLGSFAFHPVKLDGTVIVIEQRCLGLIQHWKWCA